MDAGNGLLYPLGGTRHLSIVVRLSPPPKELPAKIARVTHLTRRMQFEPSPHECVGSLRGTFVSCRMKFRAAWKAA